jgi:hypothetical protein
MRRTIFLVDLRVPLVAVTAQHRYAMGPVRETGPRGAPELPQSGICGDCPEHIEDQKATQGHHCRPRHGVYRHGETRHEQGVDESE